MRTTVTLESDVQALLKKAMRERDASFKQVLNDALREGLSARPARRRAPYRQLSFAMGKTLIDMTRATSLAAELDDQVLAERLRRGS